MIKAAAQTLSQIKCGMLPTHCIFKGIVSRYKRGLTMIVAKINFKNTVY